MADLAALVVRLQADNSQYIKALDQSTQKLSKFSSDQESLISDLASKFAAALSIDAIVQFSAAAIDSAASLDKLSASAGISVETLSGLRLAYASAGLSTEDMGASLRKLNVAIAQAAADGTSKAGTAFRALGISVRDTNGNIKDVATVQGEVADAFVKTADGANKVQIAVDLFGKSGDQLIPVLDGGSASLKAFADQATAAGLTISGPTAAAAEEFNKQISVLKEELIDGFGAQIAAQLLPALSALVAAINSTGGAAEFLSGAATVITVAFKAIAIGATIVVGAFEEVGRAMAAIAHADVDFLHGDWKGVGEDLKLGFSDALGTAKTTLSTVKDIYNAGTSRDLSPVTTTATALKPDTGSADLIKQQDAASKALEQFDASLKEQAQSFGLGEEALTRYKLQFGPLADDLKKAGAAGQAFAADAIKQAQLLQSLKDTKTTTDAAKQISEQTAALNQSDVAAFNLKVTTGDLGKALDRLGPSAANSRAELIALNNALIDAKDNKAIQGIDDELDVMNGKLTQAAAHAFDLAHQQLTQNLTARSGAGDQQATDQLKNVDALKQATVAEAAFAEQEQKRAVIESQLATVQANIALARAANQITDLQAQGQLDTAQKTEIANLQAVYAAEKQIADGSGLPKLTEQTQAFANQITSLKGSTDQLEKSVTDNLEKSFANNFEDLITGAKSFQQAVMGFLKDIEKQFLDMIAKDYAQKLFGAGGAAGGAGGALAGLFGGGASTSGGGGGIGSFLGSLIGHADGGTIGAGQFGIVGEKGPELAYSGSRNMQIIPNGRIGGVNVTNHFSVTSQNGTISRQSQNQTAALAARSLQTAAARNNR